MPRQEADQWAVSSAGFDLVMHRSWPALRVIEDRGWLLRSSRGVTKRANSVLPMARSVAGTSAEAELSSLLAAVERAEDHYRALGLPCILQRRLSTESPGLAGLLSRRGYSELGHTEIMAMNLDSEPAAVEHEQIDYSSKPTAAWLDFMAETGGLEEDAKLTLGEVLAGGRAIYGAISRRGRVVSIARLSLDVESGWAGISSVETAIAERRRGLAGALIRGLLAAGYRDGARRAFLQVEHVNAGARRLYAQLGFGHADDYFYSILAQ
ncbi:ribosomal protein S18 acetylase RimI-like enzyme [Psychromicrobium silvestre]|uniref:Ribosomal protein S18 acetylase RimI-like enzyme n=1 Tax=Psychromicrobium silvestre TaxID=1645614 RepID=A0A7Y9LRM3_9MICC|nr:ribosomal protein S18 acetylase RimI-like enzyme [Psychromicrobium silvestre]